MTPTNCGGQGREHALSVADRLLQVQRVNTAKPVATTEELQHLGGSGAPSPAQWRHRLGHLKHLEQDLALLPIGWGTDRKGPMLEGWQHHPGFTVAQLQAHRSMRSVGARTGLLTGPLLCFDFDGATSLELGLDPGSVGSWQVHRTTDANRLKVLFRPTLEQLSQLPGGAEFQGKTITAPKTDTSKGEALEVFFDGGRQVIVLGEHPSSSGHYYWPEGLGPEALTAPPAHWWERALQIAAECRTRLSAGSKTSSTRHGTKRLNPCPICGRHGSLWCEQTRDGLILCMPGVTFNAEQRHGPLSIGQVIDGWALVKRTPIAEGDVLTFKAHRPRGCSHG
ncbi:MAG: hypothetical protein RLZZ106_325 [Cyanobacteriota bacterium]